MDPSEDVDSNSSGSDQDTRAASCEPGAHQRLPPQSQDGPTLEGHARGPSLESARSQQLLPPVPDSSQRTSPRGISAQDLQNVFRRGRASSTEDYTAAPTATAALTRKPLSQACSVCEIELAAYRLGAIKATHTRAASVGHPLDPVAAARAAASITMEDLHKRQSASSTSQSTRHASDHSGVASAGTECSHRGSELVAAEAANGSDVVRRFWNSRLFIRLIALLVIVLVVGVIICVGLTVYFYHAEDTPAAGSSKDETTGPPPKDDSDGESRPRRKLHL